MKKSNVVRWVVGIMIFGCGVATGLLAEVLTDSPQRMEKMRTDLSGASGMEVIVSQAEYKPGDKLGRHFHHGVEVLYVIQGAQVQAPGKEPQTLATGSSAVNLRDIKHAGWTVIGDSSLKLFTVHVVDKGKPLYEYAE
ncbi:MAG TPA: AraC family ligand binding domain-containing protein [Burkholderiaceae bacterium]|nr:AraC family ligand binding domain-containing protein [Burkholderiaceae bacterium]